MTKKGNIEQRDGAETGNDEREGVDSRDCFVPRNDNKPSLRGGTKNVIAREARPRQSVESVSQTNRLPRSARNDDTKQPTARIPQLRFKEFDGEWEEKRLNEIAEFKKGKGISKSDIAEDGVLECIRYGELYTTYTELIEDIVSKTNLPASDLILSKFNDVIIPASGESNIDIATASCVLKSDVAFSGDLNIIRSTINGIFLSFYLNNKRKFDIARLAQGVSVVHLYSSQLKTLKLNLPSLPEQQKIASFLSAVDKKIQQLSKKKALLEAFKKGVMQQLFSGQIRFKDENGNDYPDWEKSKSKIQIIAGNAYSLNEYVNQGVMLIQGYNIGPGKLDLSQPYYISESNNTKHIELEHADILLGLNRPITNGKLKVCRYDLKDKGYLYQRAGKLKFDNSEIEPDFLYQYMKSISFLKKLSLELVGSDQPYIKSNLFQVIKLVFPSLPEQQKIASYLSSIDAKIETVSQQISQTQRFKKGLLQQLFV